jgi:hypothetical protein
MVNVNVCMAGKPFVAFPADMAVVHDHVKSLIIRALKNRFAHERGELHPSLPFGGNVSAVPLMTFRAASRLRAPR